MTAIYHLSVFLHVLSAIIWLGGMLFLALVVVPIIRDPSYQDVAAKIVHAAGVRFRTVGWVCLAVSFLTGLLNLLYRLGDWSLLSSNTFWSGAFGTALLAKLLLYVIIVLMSVVHDFYVGPHATAAWQVDPASSDARKWRRRASWYGRLNLLLGLVVVYIAIGMVRGLT